MNFYGEKKSRVDCLGKAKKDLTQNKLENDNNQTLTFGEGNERFA